MSDSDTDVLIVGAGPSGATAALALATYGVRVMSVSRFNWVADGPRAHITNQRASEVLRDLGVADDARLYASPWELMGDTPFTTSLAGEEIARIRTWGTGEERHGDYTQASPCEMFDLPQPYLEPVLVGHAAARGARFAFHTEYLGHEQDEDGVTVALRDRDTGREYSVRAKFMIGADGARSRVLEHLGIDLEGELGRAVTAYVTFEADLTRYVKHRPSILYWLMTPAAGYGEIGMGLLRAVRPWHSWIAGWGVPLEDTEPDLSVATVTQKIRTLVGDPELEPEITGTSLWHVNQASATQYSSGRVFCAGDAVHRHPPSSGLGSNTSIQDGFNLAWKLAFVVKGYAGPELLDSYEAERLPVGRAVVARANQSRVDYLPLNDCFRTTGESDPVAAGLAKLRDPSPQGAEVRAALEQALALKNYEFNAHGVELNQRYVSGAVLADPKTPEEHWERDRELYVQTTSRPGAKLPHAWLVDRRGEKVSSLDLAGHGRLTLLTGLSGQAWVAAAEQLDLPFLRVVVVGEPDAQDLYCNWARVREVAEAGALLVRPDGYVAWREIEAVHDAAAAREALARAVDHVLARGDGDPHRADTQDPSAALTQVAPAVG